MRHFYAPNLEAHNREYQMSSEESKHVVKVLRLKQGDFVLLLNGRGDFFEAEIIEVSQKACRFAIQKHFSEAKANYDLHIAIAPTKQTERMEWFIEKATELGVTKITFLDTKNGERNAVKAERFERKVISAFKQCRRAYLPELTDRTIAFSEFIRQYPKGLIAHCAEGQKLALRAVFQPTNCPVLIGPEGDFSSEEIQAALEAGYQAISLGNTRLRTETAALHACSIMKEICEK